MPHNPLLVLAVALGAGLLIGGERERRKRQRAEPAAAGIRTFALGSVAGAASLMLGGPFLLMLVVGALAAFVLFEQAKLAVREPGITTEVALVVAVLVGALAVGEPAVAAAVAVSVAILLAARTPLHNFVGSVLTADEGRDALVFAAVTLVVLPLLPDRPMGPYLALNPRAAWIVVVVILGIQAAGHVALRLLGPRFGLPVTGLASGFVSSIATIGAMGAKAAKSPPLLAPAAAGAVLSTLATIVELASVVGVTSLPTLAALTAPLVCAGLAAAAYGLAFTWLALRQSAEAPAAGGHAFSLKTALSFAATLSVILVMSAALRQAFGGAGTIAGAALAGLVDTHAAAISIAALVASGRLGPHDAVIPILAGLSTNTLTKLVVGSTAGGRGFAQRVVPGLILVIAAAWVGAGVA